MNVGQDSVASPDGRDRLALHKDAERLPIAGQDGLDDLERLVVAERFGGRSTLLVAVEGDGPFSAAAWLANVVASWRERRLDYRSAAGRAAVPRSSGASTSPEARVSSGPAILLAHIDVPRSHGPARWSNGPLPI